MRQKIFYLAPMADTVELSVEGSVMSTSGFSSKDDYGFGITDGWED